MAAGTYKATGTVKDTSGDTGTWSFTLTVTATANKITQIAPTTATTATGKAFSGRLEVSGSRGTVTYAQSSGAPDLTVSSSGAVSAPATLAAGTYTATGTVKDTFGDTGTWSFTLTVTANKLTQAAPTMATTTTGKAFTGQLKVAGSSGTVTYAQSNGAPDLKVSSSGKVSAAASLGGRRPTRQRAPRETASADTGTWSFSLTVSATKLTQTTPKTATTTTGTAFAGQLKVAGSHGTVTYAQSTGALVLKVSSSGKVSAAATLVAGTYRATGNARDTLGDTGNWSFALTVVATKLTQAAPDTASDRYRQSLLRPAQGRRLTRNCHLRPVDGRASSGGLVLGQDLGSGQLGGGDLQGNGHCERHPRGHRDLELHLDGRGQKAHAGRAGHGDQQGRQSLHRPARGLGRSWNRHVCPIERRA